MRFPLLFCLLWSLFWLSPVPAQDDRSKWDEVTWTESLCSDRMADGWESNYRTPDGSYVDILTPTLAVEVDWAPKWKEAIGQSLFYSISTGKKPAVLLLVRDWDKERVYYLRCLAVCSRYDIQLITQDVPEKKAKK
jgi:hypothetical protein